MYNLAFPGGILGGRLQLVLGTASRGPHRLRALSGQHHIIPLEGAPPVKSPLPDAALDRKIDLNGYYTAMDGQVRRLQVQGTLGGSGQLAFDPNSIRFDRFGEPVGFTLMGYPLHPITLQLASDRDPLGQGRRLYWAVSNDPKNTNRVALVLSRTEASPHRVLLYRGDQLSFIVPAFLADRREQEMQTVESKRLSPGERQAITDLQQAIRHDFRCQIDNERAVALFIALSQERPLPADILAGLPSLRSLTFSGKGSPKAGLGDLHRLTDLRTLELTTWSASPAISNPSRI